MNQTFDIMLPSDHHELGEFTAWLKRRGNSVTVGPGAQVLAVYPDADEGSEILRELWDSYCADQEGKTMSGQKVAIQGRRTDSGALEIIPGATIEDWDDIQAEGFTAHYEGDLCGWQSCDAVFSKLYRLDNDHGGSQLYFVGEAG